LVLKYENTPLKLTGVGSVGLVKLTDVMSTQLLGF
jgi:hypothetical protein